MFDLSHELYSGMPIYPGDPEVTIGPALTIENDAVLVQHVSMGSHSGTHLDAPAHTVPGGRTLDQIGLSELQGEALILRPKVQAQQAITPTDLGLQQLTSVPQIVVIATGWSEHFGSNEYFDHPYLSAEAAAQLWQLGMRLLAVDVLSPDSTPSADFPVHEIVLGGDGLIVENLTGLDQLGETARLGFFPLKLGAVDGAPVRAVAFEDE
ncbi:MAG: cyclase family protein [Canibacter sp.]